MSSLLPVSLPQRRPFLAPQTKIEPVHRMAWLWTPPLQIKLVKRPTPQGRRLRAWLQSKSIQDRIRHRLLTQLDRPRRKRKG